MYLRDISILNFRCIKSLDLKLTQGLNLIVGENNIGKTALFDAVRIALGPASATGDSLRLTKDDRHRLCDGSYVDEPVRIKLTFAGLSEAEQAQCIDILNFDPVAPKDSTAQINFQWIWNEKLERYSSKRWGGSADASESGVPDDVLQTIPVTLLGALRDATTGLLPGRNSKLANLLSNRSDQDSREILEAFIGEANTNLKEQILISGTQGLICGTLEKAAGEVLAQKASIETSEPNFERIVQSLRLVIRRQIGNTPDFFVDELSSNGLGYNNLLFLATVVLELGGRKNAILPLLFVEEPEAHLHPQLQTMLGDFLSDPQLHTAKVQTIVSSHSPTLAAHVPTKALRVFHRSPNGEARCVSVAEFKIPEPELKQLRRMFDVTKASLLFARSVILVEGVTEALLIPILARRAGYKLAENGISVVPICGVDFETIAQLFGQDRIEIPIAIITDGDPGIDDETDSVDEGEDDKENAAEKAERSTEKKKAIPWNEQMPRLDDQGKLLVCARVKKLRNVLADSQVVKVFTSDVTLEYSLAAAGKKNPARLCTVWESLFERTPKTLNKTKLDNCGGDHAAEVLAVWRGICLAKTTQSKAAFAQALASALESRDEAGNYVLAKEDFTIPEYLMEAFQHVTPHTGSTSNS